MKQMKQKHPSQGSLTQFYLLLTVMLSLWIVSGCSPEATTSNPAEMPPNEATQATTVEMSAPIHSHDAEIPDEAPDPEYWPQQMNSTGVLTKHELAPASRNDDKLYLVDLELGDGTLLHFQYWWDIQDKEQKFQSLIPGEKVVVHWLQNPWVHDVNFPDEKLLLGMERLSETDAPMVTRQTFKGKKQVFTGSVSHIFFGDTDTAYQFLADDGTVYDLYESRHMWLDYNLNLLEEGDPVTVEWRLEDTYIPDKYKIERRAVFTEIESRTGKDYLYADDADEDGGALTLEERFGPPGEPDPEDYPLFNVASGTFVSLAEIGEGENAAYRLELFMDGEFPVAFHMSKDISLPHLSEGDFIYVLYPDTESSDERILGEVVDIITSYEDPVPLPTIRHMYIGEKHTARGIFKEISEGDYIHILIEVDGEEQFFELHTRFDALDFYQLKKGQEIEFVWRHQELYIMEAEMLDVWALILDARKVSK